MKKLFLLSLISLLTACWVGVSSIPAVDFDGDGENDIGIFRPTTGLWVIRNITRTYFGTSGDTAVPADYNQNGRDDIAIFRPGSALWVAKNITRMYFGTADDQPLIGGGGGLRPIAWGLINSDGTLNYGSSNVSSTWATVRYEITISGHYCVYYNYLTLITVSGSDCRTVAITSGDGKLAVYIFECDGSDVQQSFYFMTYKKP